MTPQTVKPSILGIIPARGGSKRLPRKNVMPLRGKPVISYTIEAAMEAESLSRVIVTTDDEEIADVARSQGVDIPFVRPASLADDFSTVGDVASHAVSWLAQHEGYEPDIAVVLQPSSPLRTVQHIDEAVALCTDSGSDGCASVCEPDYHPYWMQVIVDGNLRLYEPKGQEYQRKQDLPEVYRPNGAIYVYRPEVLARQADHGRQGLMCLTLQHDIKPYIMRREDSANIDTLSDFRMAEFFLDLRASDKAG